MNQEDKKRVRLVDQALKKYVLAHDRVLRRDIPAPAELTKAVVDAKRKLVAAALNLPLPSDE